MSNKNNKKKKSRLNPETKAKIRLGFSTLVSNDACVRAGREMKWDWPIGLSVAAVIIALVPSFVSRMNVKAGNSFLGSATYGIEEGLVAFQKELVVKNAHVRFEDGKAVVENWDAMNHDTDHSWFIYESPVTGIAEFEVFFNSTGLKDQDFVDKVIDNKNPFTDAKRTAGDGTYHTNTMVLGQSNLYIFKFARNAKTATLSVIGSYARLNGVDLYDLTSKDLKGKTYVYKDKNGEEQTLAYDDADHIEEYASAIRSTWKNVLNEAYNPAKEKTAWQYAGIMAGVYVGLVLLMGLVLFLMTRGKRNPYRVITYWQSQKIACWAAFSPGVLCLLGFLLQQFALFLFVFFYGMRVMWLSMKAFRPQQ